MFHTDARSDETRRAWLYYFFNKRDESEVVKVFEPQYKKEIICENHQKADLIITSIHIYRHRKEAADFGRRDYIILSDTNAIIMKALNSSIPY